MPVPRVEREDKLGRRRAGVSVMTMCGDDGLTSADSVRRKAYIEAKY